MLRAGRGEAEEICCVGRGEGLIRMFLEVVMEMVVFVVVDGTRFNFVHGDRGDGAAGVGRGERREVGL